MRRLLEFSIRSWPANYRAEHGDELIDTAMAMGGGKATLRQAASLAAGGAQARFRAATNGSTSATWIAGIRIAIFVSLTVVVAEVTHARIYAWIHGSYGTLGEANLNEAVLGGLILAGGSALLLLLLPPRVMAVIATAAATLSWFWGPQMPRTQLMVYIVTHLGAIWFLAWRGRPAESRIAWPMALLLITSVPLALALGSFYYTTEALLLWCTLGALFFAKVDPRPLAGMCLYWAMRLAVVAVAALSGDSWFPRFAWLYSLALAVAIIGAMRVHRESARSAIP